MWRARISSAAVVGLLSLPVGLTLTSCRSPSQPAPASSLEQAGNYPTSRAAASPVATVTAPATPPSAAKHPPYKEPPIEQDATAGVRGTQIVRFAVTLGGKPIEGAHITVLNQQGKSEGDGKTDDWGEFHVGLSQQQYKVTVEWRAKTYIQQITIQPQTQSVDVKIGESQ